MGNNENVLFAALGEKDQTRTLSSAQSWTPEPNSKEQKTSPSHDSDPAKRRDELG